MEGYTFETTFKKGPNDTDDCIMDIMFNGIRIGQFKYHWMSAEDSTKDFKNLPELIRRMEYVVKSKSTTTYRTCIDNTNIHISGNTITFWISTTHYFTLYLVINESLVLAYKQLYNWFYAYRKLYDESPESTALVEDNSVFGSMYKEVKIPKNVLKKPLNPPYDI